MTAVDAGTGDEAVLMRATGVVCSVAVGDNGELVRGRTIAMFPCGVQVMSLRVALMLAGLVAFGACSGHVFVFVGRVCVFFFVPVFYHDTAVECLFHGGCRRGEKSIC